MWCGDGFDSAVDDHIERDPDRVSGLGLGLALGLGLGFKAWGLGFRVRVRVRVYICLYVWCSGAVLLCVAWCGVAMALTPLSMTTSKEALIGLGLGLGCGVVSCGVVWCALVRGVVWCAAGNNHIESCG